jgi:peptide/nickel transport system substrate-binding protein
MKRLRWQLLIVFLALVAIGILLLGQSPPPLQPIVPEPVSGGEYAEGLVGSFSRLNPVLDAYNPPDRDVDRLLFGSLIRFDDRGLPQTDLAESWGISRDGTIYNFSLRTDAFWHDGEPVTSADVVFTIQLLRDPDLPVPDDVRVIWDEIEAEALDEHTVQSRLPEPYAPFLDFLTFGILPEHLLVGLTAEELIAAPFNMQPVGSGPYRFDHLIVEDGKIAGVVLSAYDAYHGGRPFINEFIFRYYPDDVSVLAAYREGEIQGIGNVTTEILPDALEEPLLNLYTGRLPRLTLIFLNLDNPEVPFFQEVEVRRALLMGLNRQWMIDQILNSQATIADGPIFPNTWAYYDGIERLSYDQDAALRMLREAEYTIPAEGGSVRAKEGVSLAFTMLYPEGEDYASLAEAVQRDWGELGVEVDLEAVPYETLVESHLDTRLYQAVLVDIDLSRSPDPDPYPFWHQTQATGGQNYSLWNDRQASEYLEQARIIKDPAERARLYRNFQVRFVSEMPALPLYFPTYTYGVDEEIQGVRIGPFFEPSDRFALVTQWFLFSERAVEQEETPETAP